MTSPAAPAAALHLWGPPALTAALADRLGPLAAVRLRGDPLGGQLSSLLAGNAVEPPDLALPPGAMGLVLYSGLAEVLAEVLPGSGDAARGVAVWTALSGALLAVWARQRRQMLLLPAADLAADLADPQPDGPLAVLATLTGLAPFAQVGTAALPQAVAPEMRLAAAALLQTLAPARALHDRLAAASLPRQAPGLPDPAAPEALRDALEEGMRALQMRERAHALALRRHETAAETALQQARREIEAATAQPAAAQDASRAGAATEAARLAAILAEIEADRVGTAQMQATARATREAEFALQAQDAADRQAAQAATHEAEMALHADEATRMLAAQAAALARLGAGLETAEALAAARLDEAGQLARDIAARDDRIRRLAEALQHVEDDTAQLRSSHSWRVTAPLRALSRAARKLRP